MKLRHIISMLLIIPGALTPAIAAPTTHTQAITTEDIKQILTKGSAEALKKLITNGIDPNTRVDNEIPLLVMAAYTKRLEMVYTLLESGANPNAAQAPGITALSVAAATNNTHMLDLLIKHGANINHQADLGDSILMLACSQNALDAVQLLLAMKADPNLADNKGITPLIYSIARSNEPEVLCCMLLEHGADPNARMFDGSTALMVAAMNNDINCAQLLLSHGADVEVQDAGANTALDFAKSPEMRQLLLSADKND
ncbi:MAG: ankyrin repeat domain-containing protein [Akkermansia sp.]|nr:ankyrin repeat domain-containing protein [Akkermansia sp.]